MASSFFALLDDIATLMDDVAVLTKVATKKTAGVLGDDLALNAQQVAGVTPDRELPVVWAVAKGSAINKVILVPAALLISAFLPQLITPLLLIGGLFLCFEGFEKVAHKLLHSKKEEDTHHHDLIKAVADPVVDMVAFERDKIKGAVRTDFILSAEIVVISLGTVAHVTLGTRIAVLCAIAAVMTVGVYGLVAAIVKLDDMGMALTRKPGTAGLGRFIVWGAPYLMKGLSIAGTVAMFLVGGGIITHAIPGFGAWVGGLASGFVGGLLTTLADGLVGLLAGGVVAGLVLGVKKALKKG
jgi:predicted DNA repair protein MutK